jgi:AraC family transcriptional activator of mtrCDE
MAAGRPLHLFQNILSCYVDLPCFLIEAGRWDTWYPLAYLRPKRSALDYEDHWQWAARIRYNERVLERVRRTGKAVCAPFLGLHGLFVPVMDGPRCVGVLQCGTFLRAVPSPQELPARWKALTGRLPRPLDPQFQDYAQALADSPVLNAAAVEGLRQVLETVGAFLMGRLPGEEAERRLADLQVRVFAKELWHRYWVSWQVVQRHLFRFNGDAKTLMAWERAELGLTRFPTTVLAAKREGTGKEWADALAAVRFHHEARRAVKGVEEAMAYPLSNYGSLILTSPTPGLQPSVARAQLLGKAARLQAVLERRLGCRVWVGMGKDCPTGFDLEDSYHEAVAALQVGAVRGQAVTVHDGLDPAGSDAMGLRRLTTALVAAVGEGARAGAEAARDTLVQALVLGTRGRPEAARGALLGALHRLMDLVESRRMLSPEALAAFEAGLLGPLESALSLHDQVGRFGAGLDAVLSLLTKGAEGDKSLRLDRVRQSVMAEPGRPWSVPVTARQAGFSPSVFSRDFAKAVGVPFSDFVLAERLAKAKRLLLEGSLPLAQVGEACGFHSPKHFQGLFKRRVGQTPGQFRTMASKRT